MIRATMFPLMLDTDPERREQYYDRLRKQTPEERGKAAFALSNAVRRLAAVGIRERYPGISNSQLRVRLAIRLYGRDVAQRLFGDVPDDA